MALGIQLPRSLLGDDSIKAGNSAEMDSVGVTLNNEQFTTLQLLSEEHIAFSLTEACPLKCRHCIVSTVSPDVKNRTMPIERARRYGSQLSALKQEGISLISFTGGEPLLARKQIRILSDCATRTGMVCSVVTACHWATSEIAARRVLMEFPNIRNWHLSTDVFHEEFIPVENVLRAARVVLAQGRQAIVRMVASIPLSDKHLQIRQRLRTALPDDVPVVVQPVTKMGLGASIESEIPLARVPAWPCISGGMAIRYDGTVSPCCAGLIDQRDGHPFHYQNADAIGLVAAYRAWRADPLLRLIRGAGFAPLLQWVAELFPEYEVLKETPRHPCECCVRLWKDSAVAMALRRRVELPENRAKIAMLTEAVFGETRKTC